MTFLFRLPTRCMVYVSTLARSSIIPTPARMDIFLTSLVLKPTCGTAIFTDALSALVILALNCFDHLLLWYNLASGVRPMAL